MMQRSMLLLFCFFPPSLAWQSRTTSSFSLKKKEDIYLAVLLAKTTLKPNIFRGTINLFYTKNQNQNLKLTGICEFYFFLNSQTARLVFFFKKI